MTVASAINTLPDQSLRSLVLSPRRFFDALPLGRPPLKRPLIWLTVAAIFNAMVSVAAIRPQNATQLIAILMLNSIAVPLISALLNTYLLLFITGKYEDARHLMAIHAYAAAMVLPFSWIPGSQILTEPWKWIWIGIAHRSRFNLSTGRIFLTLLATIGILSGLFYGLCILTAGS